MTLSSIAKLSASINMEAAPKKAPAAADHSGRRFTSNLFAGIAIVSALAAAVAAAIIFVPAVAAVAAPVTGFLASKFGAAFAAYSIPTWAVPATFGALAAISGIISRAVRPSV